jgi:hypothetical protein
MVSPAVLEIMKRAGVGAANIDEGGTLVTSTSPSEPARAKPQRLPEVSFFTFVINLNLR